MDILVIGAGVAGLSSAARLLERGHRVTIHARERSPHTTSDVAAAVYYPYRAFPESRVIPWARATLRAFESLALDPATGVVMMDILEPFDAPTGTPWWAGMVDAYRHAVPNELPQGYQDGLVLRGPVIEMPRYLRWLDARVRGLGATIHAREVRSLDDAARGHDVVVNCAGLGARELCRDLSLVPVRGQVAYLRNPGLTRAVLDESAHLALAYVIPRSDCVVVGGTADEGAWDLAPSMRAEADILQKAIEIEPRLAGCEVIGRNVGLRPARPEVRLERIGDIIHNYGHGGSGVTLSWGCADEVCALVDAGP